MTTDEKIKNTMVCYWSAPDEVFVAESSMMPHVIMGIGKTVDEAKKDFFKVLSAAMNDIENDNVAGYKVGRPAKGYVAFNTNIQPTSKRRIAELADEMKVSQGEIVDYLVFYRDCKVQEVGLVPKQSDVFEVAQTHYSLPPNSYEMDQVLESMQASYIDVVEHTLRAFRAAGGSHPQNTLEPSILSSSSQLPLKTPSRPGLLPFASSKDKVSA
jgi:hypothetical protein